MSNALPLSALKNAGRQPALPLVLALPGEGDTLRLERLLRVLPNRRYVGVALWRDAQGQAQTVLAKLLVGPTAARHFEREKTGAALLAEQGLTTPRLLAAGFAVPVGGWLLSEYLADAQSLGERWQALEDAPSGSDAKAAQARILDEALAAIAQLHAKGLWQADLHLDNLLYQQGRLFLIDGGGIRAATPGQPLPKALALENLGVFFAQLPLRLEAELVHWLNVYLAAQPDSRLSLADRPALHKAIARQRRLRLNDLLKKIGRDCTLFKVKKTG
ncbi:MAG: hypothetical protein LBS89_07275, partial [Zoogloeaceae bacterium]|nr:hypothetical protein [Zoogloeaceae bacterium]